MWPCCKASHLSSKGTVLTVFQAAERQNSTFIIVRGSVSLFCAESRLIYYNSSVKFLKYLYCVKLSEGPALGTVPVRNSLLFNELFIPLLFAPMTDQWVTVNCPPNILFQ